MTGGNERLERIVEDGFRKDEFEKIAEVLQRVNPLARRLRTFGAAANATAGGTEKKYLHMYVIYHFIKKTMSKEK